MFIPVLHKQLLLVASKYAQKAYHPPDTNEVLISDQKTDAQVLVCKPADKSKTFHGYDAIVAFRGTSSPQDVKIDLDIRRKTPKCLEDITPKVLAHKGFTEQYDAVADHLLPHLVDCEKILTVSHSLGAACSTIFTLHMALKYPEKQVDCITFGSPRVGGPKFASLYESHMKHRISVRMVHDQDIVTKVPLPWRFTHVGEHLKISSKKSCFGIPTPITDHFMENYIEALEQLHE